MSKAYKKRKRKIELFIKNKNLKKTISWRIISLIISFSIGYLLTGSLELGGLIAILDTVIKMGIFYYHETRWNRWTTKKIKKIKADFNKPRKYEKKQIKQKQGR